ncbi:hypothetical protein BaRGS_00020931 [Batillaria attramentaria]|uniref:Uncharacterized protein n=1 Tax=Batillaria attramentaria TaxID=370345 RepID=A0ABD0KL98_9CAEN
MEVKCPYSWRACGGEEPTRAAKARHKAESRTAHLRAMLDATNPAQDDVRHHQQLRAMLDATSPAQGDVRRHQPSSGRF